MDVRNLGAQIAYFYEPKLEFVEIEKAEYCWQVVCRNQAREIIVFDIEDCIVKMREDFSFERIEKKISISDDIVFLYLKKACSLMQNKILSTQVKLLDVGLTALNKENVLASYAELLSLPQFVVTNLFLLISVEEVRQIFLENVFNWFTAIRLPINFLEKLSREPLSLDVSGAKRFCETLEDLRRDDLYVQEDTQWLEFLKFSKEFRGLGKRQKDLCDQQQQMRFDLQDKEFRQRSALNRRMNNLVERLSRRRAKLEKEFLSAGLSPEKVESAVLADLKQEANFSCGICLCEFLDLEASNDMVEQKCCGQLFCSDCLIKNLQVSQLCPACRKRC